MKLSESLFVYNIPYVNYVTAFDVVFVFHVVVLVQITQFLYKNHFTMTH